MLERGFRVVLTFDGTGHYHSGGKRTNLLHFGGAVRAVFNQVGGAYGVITHSFGGASTVLPSPTWIPASRSKSWCSSERPATWVKCSTMRPTPSTSRTPAARQFFRYLEKKVKFPVRLVMSAPLPGASG
ncbi:MAG: hypothetical protein H6559_35595 [Lewinellaceae bacterium]|nr:hypothetical protein [Lewinellaceae bacterium]